MAPGPVLLVEPLAASSPHLGLGSTLGLYPLGLDGYIGLALAG